MSSDAAGASATEKEGHRMLTPSLRFSGFIDSWLRLMMTEVYQFKGTNSLSREQLNYEGGRLKTIHYGDIHKKFSSGFRAGDERVPFVNEGETQFSLREANWCSTGDIVFADASEDMDDIGKAIEIIDPGSIPLTAGLHTILARPDLCQITIGFGRYLFASQAVRQQIQKQAQGAKVLGISSTRLGSIEIALPSDTAEQRKIADCLSSLDEVIAAEEDHVAALREYKKGLLQALLPAEGQMTPRRRFPEFQNAGEWKRCQLRELLFESRRRNRDLEFSPEHVLSVSGEYGCVNQIKFMGRSYAGVTVKDYHVVETDDVVYTKSPLKAAPYGVIKSNKGKVGIVSTLYAVYRPHSSASSGFIDHYFSSMHNLNSYLQPLVRKGPKNDMKVGNGEVLTGYVVAPDKSEQERIANCLSSVDALVAATRDRLAMLRDHKGGLLQRLFPSPNEAVA